MLPLSQPPVPLLGYTPRPPAKLRTKFRVAVYEAWGVMRMLSEPLDAHASQFVLAAFDRDGRWHHATILSDTRSLRRLWAQAGERGVVRFRAYVGGNCPCGCGRPNVIVKGIAGGVSQESHCPPSA
jgi:hypothetical protein